ncbi:MAG: AsmA family protein [Bacteroidetes bacterium]|nr:AsmA family protein [Bacteroidota bacterium]MCL1969070.1 AsmA family protein [Bacteroidota bacterium]
MKRSVKWIIISLSTIIGLIVIAFLLFLFLLTPKRLTPIVNKYCTEFFDAKVTFDTVYLSLFEEFPKVSVKLMGGEIISNSLKKDTAFLALHPQNADTLLRFNELMVSLNVKDLLQSKINIERIRLSQPDIFGYISPSGQANWDIVKPSESADSTQLDLHIDRIAIRGPALVNLKSCPDSMDIQASIGRLFVKGNITLDMAQIDIKKFVFSNLTVNADLRKEHIYACLALDSAAVDIIDPRKEYKLNIEGMASASVENQQYLDKLPLKLNGTLRTDLDNFKAFGFKDFCLTVANLPEVKLNGDILLNEGYINSDLECKIEKIPLQSLLDIIPETVSEEIKKIKTNIIITLNTNIRGVYEFAEKGKLPMVDVNLKIPKGFLIYKDLESKIDNIAVDASFHFDPFSPQETGIKLKTFNVDAFAVKLEGNVNVTNLFDDPYVVMKVKGSANLRELQKFVPEDFGVTARGNISFNAEGSFLASRLNQQDLAQNNLIVQFNADRVRVRIPKDTISVLVEKTFLEINTTKTRTSKRTGEVFKLLSLDFKSDTARIRMPNRQIIAFSKIDLSMRSSDAALTGDTSNVIPLIGEVTANSLQYSDVDSTTILLRDMKTNIRILPSRENRTLPSIRFEVETKQIRFFSQGNRVMARDAALSIVATKNDPALLKERMNANRRNANQGNTGGQRESNRRADDFAGEDLNIRDVETGRLLREWTVDGSLKSRTGRVVSPHFPLRTRLQNIDITFTTNDITLQNLDIKSGESKLKVTGKVDNIRRALSSGRGLRIEADIKADTLNMNQLLTAFYNGAAYSGASEEYKKAVTNADGEEQLEQIIQNENERNKATSVLLVIPSNVSLNLKLDVGYAQYADIMINKLTCELVSRDRCIQLKDFVAQTSVGEIDLTALYATRSKKDITFGLDLEFKEILVEDFIRIIPSVDSLVPMLASFRGVVNCQLAATAALDTTMNIELPSLNTACRISGKNLVLLDGKTFSEIANTLKFKNRDKNLVERISVELLVRNNRIEIFPFIMEIDRYKTAISGIHNLDMTFNYHVSVLKSPLPFKLGVNLKGDLEDMDNMKIAIGKAKYKDTNLPTYVTVIDTTRLNLRAQIDSFIRQGVDVARFSQFSTPTIDPTLIEKDTDNPTFSAQDSLILYKEGIIDVKPKSISDTVPVIR